MRALLLLLLLFTSVSLAQDPDLRWELDAAADVAGAYHLTGAAVEHGVFGGLSVWDPYIYLRLPDEGISAADYRSLEARIYSSTPADQLDIYYKSEAGHWCLGGSLRIERGWATYSVDLEANEWREAGSPEARKWGGPDGQVVMLRLDPGNQEGRWMMVDWARLTPDALPVEVRPDERAEAAVTQVQAPDRIAAGEACEVRLTLTGDAQGVTAYARLQSTGTLIASAQQTLDLEAGRPAEVTLSLPTLPFLSTEASVLAGVYEAPVEDEQAVARVAIVDETDPRRLPKSEVRQLGGSPAVYVDGRLTPLFTFVGYSPGSELDRSRPSRHAEMAAAGVPIFSDWFGTSGAGDLGHVAPGEYDYTVYDLYFARMVAQAPDALFLPHVYVTPPMWWQDANPEELCEYHDGGKGPQSFSSGKWMREIGDDLTRLISHLRSAPYADRIIGVTICSGHSAEWQTWGLWSSKFADYSAPAEAAYRRWLRAKYRSDDALREAWGRPEASIDAAATPTPERRNAAAHGLLRDPVADRDVIDYQTFINGSIADAILHFSELAKKASSRRLLVGTYYGYLTAHGFHQAESGHCALERVLASDDIDFLMSPPQYAGREIGGVSSFMSVVNSVHAHGKIWVSEADYRTHLSAPGSGYGRADDLDDSLAILWREFAHVLCRRAGVSWYDMADGWLRGPDIPPELGKMARIMESYLPEREPFHAEVAVFIDPASFHYTRPDIQVGRNLTLEPMLHLNRTGGPFDIYLLSDLWTAELPDYKLYVFLNAYALDARARQAIEARLSPPGAAALWHWAAGYADPRAPTLLSDEELSEFLGIDVRRIANTDVLRLSADGGDAQYAARIAATPESWLPALALDPLFVPESGDVLLRTEPGDHAALVRSEVGGRLTFYSALPCLPPGVLHQIYRDAGVHVYADPGDCFYTDGSWLSLHARTDGPKRLDLPGDWALTSALTGWAASGRELSLPLPQHATELLRVGER